MNLNRKQRNSSIAVKRLVLLNRYYRITRFYEFIRNTSIKGGIVIAVFVAVMLGLEYFVLDFNALLNTLVQTYSPLVVFSSFFISESFLGLLPPEIYMAWASKAATPWLFLGLLASLSYLGGIVAYFSGQFLAKIPSVKNHIEIKVARHIVNLRKWGGLFVFIGAMLPLPHSIVSLACGLINYDFKNYLFWALFRFVRFAAYAFVIFSIF